MGQAPGVCAACGNGTTPGLRFCTRCGASLSIETTDDAVERAARELRNRAILLGARGVITILLSVPFMVMSLAAALVGTVPFLMVPLAILLGVLAVLGCRDVSRAFRILTDGSAAMAEWKAMGGRIPESAPDALSPSPQRGLTTRALEDGAEAPPSVTEHTTFRLDDRRDDA
jgi:hypothetical protein